MFTRKKFPNTSSTRLRIWRIIGSPGAQGVFITLKMSVQLLHKNKKKKSLKSEKKSKIREIKKIKFSYTFLEVIYPSYLFPYVLSITIFQFTGYLKSVDESVTKSPDKMPLKNATNHSVISSLFTTYHLLQCDIRFYCSDISKESYFVRGSSEVFKLLIFIYVRFIDILFIFICFWRLDF